ncbi:MAG TPA: hypothetical protein VKZ67_05600 [Natronosporangium sp.]|nr:hypothetical protein [Natronosporangium sp.]
MFIQVIQGHITDPTEMRDALDTWYRDLAPGAAGWLGTTAGVTADQELIMLVRFESPEAARRNSDRPEQHQWWMQTAKLFTGTATFYDCRRCETFLAGGSDKAGFVQVIQGHSDDLPRLVEINRETEEILRKWRPEIIGGVLAQHDDGAGDFTQAVYFTDEATAREGERKQPPPELVDLMKDEQQLWGEPRFYDLTDPWFYSPTR